MRYLIISLFCVFGNHLCTAQINELGIILGGSNFIGDVGATSYIAPNEFAIGGIYKWNRSKRHSYRFSVLFTDLKGVDAKSDDPRRIQRNYKFVNDITEISAGIEFTFFDFDLHKKESVITPYLFTGLTATFYDNYYFTSGTQTSEETNSWTLGIPMTLGFKVSFLERFVLGAEIGARYTFTDALDGSYPSEHNVQQYGFGNLNNNDWYMFTGITLTYTFGERPCYCTE
ncbi:MAG: DUF6089 family protein [Aestuariibaculum sp.]